MYQEQLGQREMAWIRENVLNIKRSEPGNHKHPRISWLEENPHGFQITKIYFREKMLKKTK